MWIVIENNNNTARVESFLGLNNIRKPIQYKRKRPCVPGVEVSL